MLIYVVMVLVNSVVVAFRFSGFEFSLVCCLGCSCVALLILACVVSDCLACFVCKWLLMFWFEFGLVCVFLLRGVA